MPTYEYKCDKCGHKFERFQKMSDKPLSSCPECNGAVRRLLGKGAGIIFKGAGFHAADIGSNRPSCGREKTCCGREIPCGGKS